MEWHQCDVIATVNQNVVYHIKTDSKIQKYRLFFLNSIESIFFSLVEMPIERKKEN